MEEAPHPMSADSDDSTAVDPAAGAAPQEQHEPAGADDAPVLVSGGARFEGLVSFAGRARVEGEVSGEIIGEAGTLLLGPDAEVRARVEVDELVVGGLIAGDVRARLRVEVTETGVVEGELQTPRLSVADGGQLRARCITRAPEPSDPGEDPGGEAGEEPPVSL
jgi:cytoskeletal protein CcmA (bactofilin family)